jgi:hypothetical protein
MGGSPVTDPVDEHREVLETLAEHGHTELAEDAAAVLEAAEEE